MRKSVLIRLCAGVLLGGALWVAYTQNFGQQPAKLNTTRIREDLYLIHNDLVPGNTTALITSAGVILVDDKFEIDHNNIMSELKKITNQPVKYVINTHHHADHSGGNAKMQQMNAQIVASDEAWQNMIEGQQPGPPNVTFAHEARIHLGGKTVELYHFGRSHTNGDVVVYFPADRVLAAGDMFTFGDDVPELIDYSGGGSAKEWPRTLDSALMLDFELVVPGHGLLTSKQEMRKFRNSTAMLVTRVHQLVTQKKSKDDVAKMLRKEFHWADLHLARGLDGAMAEMQ
ncbi:MAG: MBL fold metallo-hydrolase [Acidobacteriia bacterium]|nr:MBL fold metallo-hydrolase [Terriglobia bacterium]